MGYSKCILHCSLVCGNFGLEHGFCILSNPVDVGKLDSRNVVHQVSLSDSDWNSKRNDRIDCVRTATLYE